MTEKGQAGSGNIRRLQRSGRNTREDFINGTAFAKHLPGGAAPQRRTKSLQIVTEMVLWRLNPVEKLQAIIGNAFEERRTCRTGHDLSRIERHKTFSHTPFAQFQVNEMARKCFMHRQVLEAESGVRKAHIQQHLPSREVAIGRIGHVALSNRRDPFAAQPIGLQYVREPAASVTRLPLKVCKHVEYLVFRYPGMFLPTCKILQKVSASEAQFVQRLANAFVITPG